MSTVIITFGAVHKSVERGLEELEIRGRIETILTTELLRSARILRRVLGTRWNLLSLIFKWKPISKLWCENLTRNIIIIMIIIIIIVIIMKGTYKYLGILESDTIKQVEIKERNLKKYLRRTRKLLETKLYCRNLGKGINT